MLRVLLLIPITFVYSHQYFHHNFYWYPVNKPKNYDYREDDYYDTSKEIKSDNFGQSSHNYHFGQPWDYDYFGKPWQTQNTRTTSKPKKNYYPSDTHIYHNTPSDIDDPTKYPFGERVHTTKKPNRNYFGHPWSKNTERHPWTNKKPHFESSDTSKSDNDDKIYFPGQPWDQYYTSMGQKRPENQYPGHMRPVKPSTTTTEKYYDQTQAPIGHPLHNHPPGHPWHRPETWMGQKRPENPIPGHIHPIKPSSTTTEKYYYQTQAPIGHPEHNHPPGHPWHHPETWMGQKRPENQIPGHISPEKQTTTEKYNDQTPGQPWYVSETWMGHKNPTTGHINPEKITTTTEISDLGPNSGQESQNFPIDVPKSDSVLPETISSILITENDPETTSRVPDSVPKVENVPKMTSSVSENIPITPSNIPVSSTTEESPNSSDKNSYTTIENSNFDINLGEAVPINVPTTEIVPKSTTSIPNTSSFIITVEETTNNDFGTFTNGIPEKSTSTPIKENKITQNIYTSAPNLNLGPDLVQVTPPNFEIDSQKEIIYVSNTKNDDKLLQNDNDPIINIIPIISSENGIKNGPPLLKIQPPVIFIDETEKKVISNPEKEFIITDVDRVQDSIKINTAHPIVVLDDYKDNRAKDVNFIKNVLKNVENVPEIDLNNLPPNVQIITNQNEIDSIKKQYNIDQKNETKWYYSTVLKENEPYVSEKVEVGKDILKLVKSDVLDDLKTNITLPEDLEAIKDDIKSLILKKLDIYQDTTHTPRRTTRENKNIQKDIVDVFGLEEKVPEDVEKTIKNLFNIRDSLPIEPNKKDLCSGNNECQNNKDFSFIPDTNKKEDNLIKQINSGTYDISSLLLPGENPEMYPPEVLEAIQKEIGGAINKGHINYFSSLLKEDKNADVSSVYQLRFKNVGSNK